MAQIDAYLRGVVAKAGEELWLGTGDAPAARTAGKPTPINNAAMTTDQIEALLKEIVPARRAQEQKFRFQYTAPFGAWQGVVQRGDGKVQAIIRKHGLPQPEFEVALEEAPLSAAAADEPDLSAAEPEPVAPPVQAPPTQAPAPAAPRPATAAPSAPRPAAPPPAPATPPPPPAPAAAAVPPPAGPPPAVATITAQAFAPAAAAGAVPIGFGVLPQVRVSTGAPGIDRLLDKMSKAKASDLHLSSTCKPMIRVDGSMVVMPGENVMDPSACWSLVYPIMPERNRIQFDALRDTDFAYELKGVGRFRCNIFMDRKGPGGVFRIIPTKILTVEDLHLPEVVRGFANLSKGLVLVTGPTGSGKSTTLAAIVDLVNSVRDDHLITIEDPIEFVHENRRCLVNQREVFSHTTGFKHALRAALREDPDIVLVGEMRDLETIEIAIETAETGHLVFGTLHTTTAPSTVDRVIEQFPADRQEQIRVMLSESLKAVVAQTLCKKVGGGRIAALEILVVNGAVANLIREGKTFQIPNIIQTSKGEGMQTFNDVLADYVKKGVVEAKEAYIKAVDKKGFLETLENMKYNTTNLIAQLSHLG